MIVLWIALAQLWFGGFLWGCGNLKLLNMDHWVEAILAILLSAVAWPALYLKFLMEK